MNSISNANLEEWEEVDVEVSGNHAQREHDHRRRAHVEAHLAPEEVCDRAEDEGAEDEADHGEGEQVRDVVGLKWRRGLLSLRPGNKERVTPSA